MLTTYERHAKMKLATTIISVIVIAGIVMLADHLKAKHTADTSVAAQTNAAATSTTTATDSASYKDGSYSASSSYVVPPGQESIQVSLTLKSGTITDVSVQNSEGDPDSANFQEAFASTYKSYVVGKKISGLRLTNIAGASDTTQGFNDALSQIASKAQA